MPPCPWRPLPLQTNALSCRWKNSEHQHIHRAREQRRQGSLSVGGIDLGKGVIDLLEGSSSILLRGLVKDGEDGRHKGLWAQVRIS